MLINLPPYSAAGNGVGTFLPPAGGISDPLWDQVVVLMHMNDGAFTDVCGNQIINSGVTYDTTKKKFGTGSAKHAEASLLEIVYTPKMALLSEFCIEGFAALTATVGQGAVFLGRWGIGPSTSTDWIFIIRADGSLEWAGGSGGTAPAGSFPLDGNFHHIVADRYNGQISLYVDGVRKAQFANTGTSGGSGRNWRTAHWDAASGMVGNIDELRVTNGTSRYKGAATIGIPGAEFKSDQYDPYRSFVRLHMAMDGANGDTALVDQLNGQARVWGTTALNTATKKYGTASVSVPGSAPCGIAVTPPAGEDISYYDIGNREFTMEGWIYPRALTSAQLFGNLRWYIGYRGGWNLTLGANGALGINFDNSHTVSSAAAAVVANAWQHIAVTVTANVWRIFVNGVVVASSTQAFAGVAVSNAYSSAAGGIDYVGDMRIGYRTGDGAFDSMFNGLFDDVRFTLGVARYKAAFNPPQAALPSKGPNNLGGGWDTTYDAANVVYANNKVTLGPDEWTRSARTFNTGLIHFEARVDNWTAAAGPALGIIPDAGASGHMTTGAIAVYLESATSLKIIRSGVIGAVWKTVTAIKNGDILGVEVNVEAGTMEFFRNGDSVGIVATDVPAGSYRALLTSPHTYTDSTFTALFGTAAS